MNGAGESDEADAAVTVLVARRVAPGKEIEFEEWASELTRVASSFDGFLGAVRCGQAALVKRGMS